MPAAERLPTIGALPLASTDLRVMDVNYCLTREQVELSLARAATHPGARAAHIGLARNYRRAIDDYRDAAVRESDAH